MLIAICFEAALILFVLTLLLLVIRDHDYLKRRIGALEADVSAANVDKRAATDYAKLEQTAAWFREMGIAVDLERLDT